MNATSTHGRLLSRLKAAIRKYGPLSWSAARLAMFGGSYDRRDAAFHNATITEWVQGGELRTEELPDGDSIIVLA